MYLQMSTHLSNGRHHPLLLQVVKALRVILTTPVQDVDPQVVDVNLQVDLDSRSIDEDLVICRTDPSTASPTPINHTKSTVDY